MRCVGWFGACCNDLGDKYKPLSRWIIVSLSKRFELVFGNLKTFVDLVLSVPPRSFFLCIKESLLTNKYVIFDFIAFQKSGHDCSISMDNKTFINDNSKSLSKCKYTLNLLLHKQDLIISN